MQKNVWPEIVLGSGDTRVSQAIRRAVKAGELRKIASRLYSPNFDDNPADIVRRNSYQLLAELYPGALISHRSALEGGVNREDVIVLTYGYTRTVRYPGLEIRLLKGPGPDEIDTPFLNKLFIASRPRAFLENLQPSRERAGFIKTLPAEEIEERLDRVIRVYGSEELLDLRDQAREVAERLDMRSEFQRLDGLIGGLLGTRPAQKLRSDVAKARSRGVGYDTQRLQLFLVLSAYLHQCDVPVREQTAPGGEALRNLAFFESYFSNYIEGTCFEVAEAQRIVFQGIPSLDRPEDSHDILGTFRLVSDARLMRITPSDPEDLANILKQRHAVLMEGRSIAGRFKDRVNRAGDTVFVKPDEVQGTLTKGFEIYRELAPGLRRAIFLMFLVAEVHPFIDGNGRVARIVMNAELDAAKQCRIMIPTVYRDDYLFALRRLSRQGDPDPYVRMLCRAQEFTAALDIDDFDTLQTQLQAAQAFHEPNKGRLTIPRSLG